MLSHYFIGCFNSWQLFFNGASLFQGCALGLKQCSEVNPWHHRFKNIRNELKEMLEGITIGSFNDDLVKGLLSLKN